MSTHAPNFGTVLDASRLEVGRGAPLLPPVTFAVQRGQLWAVIGPNGAGKSTLFRTLLGLLKPVSGSGGVFGGARLAYVPQRATIGRDLPARSRDVVASGVDREWSFLDPMAPRRARAAVDEALRAVGGSALESTPFGALSEGQKQRILVARALAGSPDVVLLDEPTSAMDLEAEHRLLELLERLAATRSIGVLIVSHHVPVVAEFATHALVLDRDRQRVVAGPIDEVAEHPVVGRLYGRMLADRSRHLPAAGAHHD